MPGHRGRGAVAAERREGGRLHAAAQGARTGGGRGHHVGLSQRVSQKLGVLFGFVLKPSEKGYQKQRTFFVGALLGRETKNTTSCEGLFTGKPQRMKCPNPCFDRAPFLHQTTSHGTPEPVMRFQPLPSLAEAALLHMPLSLVQRGLQLTCDGRPTNHLNSGVVGGGSGGRMLGRLWPSQLSQSGAIRVEG